MKIVLTLDPSEIINDVNNFNILYKKNLAIRLDILGFKIVADAQSLAPHGFGGLAESISHEVITENNNVFLVIGSYMLYAEAVEKGSRPHWPPYSKSNPASAPLRAWAKRYLGDEEAVYALAAHIAKYGTKAQPFLLPALEANQDGFIEAMNLAFADTVDEMGG